MLEEVPDEITLAFNISGCPHHCDGCHSQNLWEYTGEYLAKDIRSIIEEYKDYITCVCFMGGDQNMKELSELSQMIKEDYKMKVCIYSGEEVLDKFFHLMITGYLDYIKIGRYDKNLGGLNSKTTNQRMYVCKGEVPRLVYQDITKHFQKGEN